MAAAPAGRQRTPLRAGSEPHSSGHARRPSTAALKGRRRIPIMTASAVRGPEWGRKVGHEARIKLHEIDTGV